MTELKQVLKHPSRFWLLGAVCLLVIHAGLLAAGSFARSYDAWTHLFFASHWMQNWWSDIEPRWYGGFSVLTYPPFSHQTLAVPAKLIGLEASFVLMQTLALGFLGLGLWRYTRIWFSERAAWLAAVLGLSLPALAMTVHLFGQYPNTVSLALVLNLLPWVHRWLQRGQLSDLIKAELLLIPAALTSLFTNFLGLALFALPVLVQAVKSNHNPDSDADSDAEKAERLTRLSQPVQLVLLVILGGLTLGSCLLPLFQYLNASPLVQTVIPHASRDNVLISDQGYFTFYGLYGPLLPLIPVLLLWLFKHRRWDFALPILLMLGLSLGGANPLNQLMLGRFFEILTFDRFAFWNSLLILPPLAAWLSQTCDSALARWPRRRCLSLGLGAAVIYGLFFGVNATSPFWKPLAPLLDTAPLAARLNQPEFQDCRFLSIGLGGNNLAALTSKIQTPTIDGNYNFARRLPELNQAPIALLDEAKYYGEPGVDALAKILADPAKYGIRWVLLRDLYYTPLLQTMNWQLVGGLGQDVQLWKTRLPLPASLPTPEQAPQTPAPLWARLLWGITPWLPLLILALWLSVNQISRPKPAQVST